MIYVTDQHTLVTVVLALIVGSTTLLLKSVKHLFTAAVIQMETISKLKQTVQENARVSLFPQHYIS